MQSSNLTFLVTEQVQEIYSYRIGQTVPYPVRSSILICEFSYIDLITSLKLIVLEYLSSAYITI